jgi:hypothetical protein
MQHEYCVAAGELLSDPNIAGRGDCDLPGKKNEYGFALYQYQSDATLRMTRVSAPHRGLAVPWRKRIDDDGVQINWIGAEIKDAWGRAVEFPIL